MPNGRMAPHAAYSQNFWRNGAKQQAAFEAVNLKMYPPRVVFDNDSDPYSTLITVDSANKQGCLLEVVQLLTDLDLVISKARISSDGGWFVDVFHVTDQHGAKVTDPKMIAYIQQTLGAGKSIPTPVEVQTCTGRTAWDIDALRMKHHGIELSGADRTGLLHDLAAEISALGCSVLAAEVWTHNGRVAFVIYAAEASGAPITDPALLSMLRERLRTVMTAESTSGSEPVAKITDGKTHASRRMHQMMFASRDFEAAKTAQQGDEAFPFLRPMISVRNSPELGYSVVNVKCADRSKLLFDTVCTLTDMQYIIHHATIESDNGLAMQEYFIRSWEGGVLESEAERERVVKCLDAAIQRHTPAGICLELCASDRIGLLADVTRVFKEKELSIAAATVSTRKGKAVNEFYVVGRNGEAVNRKVLESVQQQIGTNLLVIRSPTTSTPGSPAREEVAQAFSFTNLLRVQSERLLASLGLSTSPPTPSSLP